MSVAPHPKTEGRETYRPFVDNRPFFIETKSRTGGAC